MFRIFFILDLGVMFCEKGSVFLAHYASDVIRSLFFWKKFFFVFVYILCGTSEAKQWRSN